MTHVLTLDAATLKLVETREGYLRGSAIASRVGVFKYQNPDGTTRLELRHPSEVLKRESLDTLKQIPVTTDHPPVMVNASNAKQYSTGFTGEQWESDNDGNIIINFTVTDKRTVELIKSGQATQLSLGYVQKLVPESGIYNGESYTHKQTNIIYNHLAIVSKARAGDVASIRLDGLQELLFNIDAESIDPIKEVEPVTNPAPAPRMDSVTVNGIAYQASPEVRLALEAARKDADEKQATIDKLKKDMAEGKAKYDEAAAKLKEMEDKAENKDSEIADAVKAKLSLIEQAGQFINKDGLAAKSDKDIMVAVIKSQHPTFDASGDQGEMAYIKPRFDAVLDMKKLNAKPPSSVAKQQAGMVGNTDAAQPQQRTQKTAQDYFRSARG
jgi:uncharacterized protein